MADSVRVKRGVKAKLPTSLPLGELAFCTDTRELFVGAGEGLPLKKVVDQEVLEGQQKLNKQLNNTASKDDVAKISSGNPLFADDISKMTDITRNYVNTTDGFLYIYSNNTWTKTNVKYQSSGVAHKSITNKELSDDITFSPNALIRMEKNLLDLNYLTSPMSFISWHNSANTTIIEDSLNKINNFKTVNIKCSSQNTQWVMCKDIPYSQQGKLTFSYLRKAHVLHGQNVNAVDSNNKWYAGSAEVVKDYYKGWDLVKYTINIDTSIENIAFYLGSFNGENTYNVGLFSITKGEYVDILPKWGLNELDDNVKNKINKVGELDSKVVKLDSKVVKLDDKVKEIDVEVKMSLNEHKINNLGGLINESYSLNPKSFIEWHNSSSSTLQNNTTIISPYPALNCVTNLSGGIHYLNAIDIQSPSKGKYVFSYLVKTNNGDKPIIEAMDNTGKYYRPNGAVYTTKKNYYNGYDLDVFSFDINTTITKLTMLIGYSKGTSNFDIGMFSLWQGNKQLEIVNDKIITYAKLDNSLKTKIDKIGELDTKLDEIDDILSTSTIDVTNYDMLLPRKIFMINEEPLRLYKKNIVVSADDIRDLELSVVSYNDDVYWSDSKQPYVEYINDKLELQTSDIIGNKVKFNLVGNDLKTRLTKEVEVVSRNKSSVAGKSIVVNMFGDSTSQNGLTYSVSKLLSKCVTRKMIGTKTVNGTPAEARGGWLYLQYVGYRTTYSHNDQAISEADFPNFLKLATSEDKANKGDWCYTRTGSNREKTYNEVKASGGNLNQNFYIFDYANYLKINNFEKPHFVTLGMGINDEWKYPNDYLTLCEKALNIMIRQIHEASPDTKFVLQPFPTKGSNEVKVDWFKKCLELETYFRNTVGVDIEIVAEHLSQNKDLFFPTTKTELSNKVANKEVINDDIHTTLAGYSEGARPIVYCILNKI